MITIKDKKDSVYKMKQLDLSHFPQDVFEVEDRQAIKEFFEKYPAEEYVLRSPEKASGKFFFVKSYEDAERFLDNYEEEVTISVSMRTYKEDIVLLGDIMVKREGGMEIVDISARDDENANHRNIYSEPQYNFHTSLEDDRLWRLPGFSKLMRYISDHELYDVILEFAVYAVKAGIKKDNVVIIEMRTGY